MKTMLKVAPADLTAQIRSLRNDCEALSRQADIMAEDKRRALEQAQTAAKRPSEEAMAGFIRELENATRQARQLRAVLVALP